MTEGCKSSGKSRKGDGDRRRPPVQRLPRLRVVTASECVFMKLGATTSAVSNNHHNAGDTSATADASRNTLVVAGQLVAVTQPAALPTLKL